MPDIRNRSDLRQQGLKAGFIQFRNIKKYGMCYTLGVREKFMPFTYQIVVGSQRKDFSF